MSLVLDTNINSLNAQNNLTGSQALLSQSLERLSSGLRINRAADDAAGLAISQQFTTQINGANQAINNANDAVSEAQTTAGALTTIVNNLQSIRTLAVEAANGSNSASDRTSLNNQVQQQIQEITQIAQQTTFNGLDVLNGSSGTTVYQVGANVGDTIAVSLQQGVAASQIGQYSTQTGGAVTGALTSTGGTTASTYYLSINGQAIYSGAGNVAAGSTLTGAQVAAQINLYTGTTGVTASVNTSGDVTLSNTDGSAISVSQTITLGTGASGTGLSAAVAGSVATPKVTQGKVTLIDSKPVTITDVGTAGGSAALGFTSGQATTLSTTSTGATATLANQDVLTASVDSALATVSAFQAQLGAIQDRFTSAVSNLTSTAQNLTQSRSTIQDADFAAETANLTQAQVLEQAGISVLAQANQQPQLILKLLQ
jgi:flagellin